MTAYDVVNEFETNDDLIEQILFARSEEDIVSLIVFCFAKKGKALDRETARAGYRKEFKRK